MVSFPQLLKTVAVFLQGNQVPPEENNGKQNVISYESIKNLPKWENDELEKDKFLQVSSQFLAKHYEEDEANRESRNDYAVMSARAMNFANQADNSLTKKWILEVFQPYIDPQYQAQFIKIVKSKTGVELDIPAPSTILQPENEDVQTENFETQESIIDYATVPKSTAAVKPSFTSVLQGLKRTNNSQEQQQWRDIIPSIENKGNSQGRHL